jgi:hypothetical protein
VLVVRCIVEEGVDPAGGTGVEREVAEFLAEAPLGLGAAVQRAEAAIGAS